MILSVNPIYRQIYQAVFSPIRVISSQTAVVMPTGKSRVGSAIGIRANERSHFAWEDLIACATPERRGVDFDIIEDVIPIYNIRVSVKLPMKVNSVTLVPQNAAIPFKLHNQRIEFDLKEVKGHQMIAFS